MASPQKENGYTPIANELLEKIIATGLNGTELSIILLILRKTYGFQKKEDEISLSQFERYIPVSKKSITLALNNLKLVKIITLVKKGSSLKHSNKWVFNKNYDEWQLVKKSKLVKKPSSTSVENVRQLVKKTSHTKEIYKRNIQKKYIAEQSSAIPDLLKDKQKHIQIIGIYSKAKKVDFSSKGEVDSFIKRNLRAATDLVPYPSDRIIATMKYLIDHADFKWTLESVGKYIDEDLDNLNNKLKVTIL